MQQRHQTIPRSLCFVFNAEKQLLLVKFSENKGEMQGFYNPPGGHIEKEEGILENAEKEIYEETGLKVTATCLKGVLHATNFFGKDIMLFVTESKAVDPAIPADFEFEEGQPEWIDLNKINEIKIFEDIKLILNKLQGLKAGEIFTAKSRFDGKGKLLALDFEK